MKRAFDRAISRAPDVARDDGNLFAASQPHAIGGGHRRPVAKALLGAGAAGVVGFALYSLARR